MYTPYVRFANPQTQLDPTAKNTPGSIYSPPPGTYSSSTSSPVFSTTAGSSTAGYGAPGVFKYVYFYDASALTGTAQVSPAPVYYIDESFTTVTPNAADAFFTTGGAMVAGYWMPNTTSLGTSLSAANWYLQMVQSYGWIQIGGFLAGALVPSTLGSDAAGNVVQGLTTGSWVSTSNTTLQASGRVLGVQLHASATSQIDILVGGLESFWGS
jgi:hypothetical protein